MPSRFLRTAPHEFDANLVFGEEGLKPFFAFERVIRDVGGSAERSIEIEDDRVQATLYYQESGIGSLNHSESDLDTIREFRVTWTFQDAVGEKSGTFHVAPRTPNMVDKSGDPISTPPNLVGVNVRAQGSNLEFEEYPALFRRLVSAFGINAGYFETGKIHEHSNIQDAARYVRIERDLSGRFHATDGALARIAHVLANDREGFRQHKADDRIAPGYNHTTQVGPMRAGELVDGHQYPKRVKHYLPREPEAFDPDDPLYHPKLEVGYQTNLDRDSPGWASLDQVTRELDELLLNVLEWEDLPASPPDDARRRGLDSVFVEDQYFRIETERRGRSITPDPTPKMKDRQENVVIRHLKDGLEESDFEVLQALVTDGGEISPSDLADETGRHLETIYRALSRMDDLVEHTYGEVALRSPFIAEQVTQAVQHAEDALVTAAETAGQALELAADEMRCSALVEWLRAYGVDVKNRDDGRLQLRMGNVPGASHPGDVRDALLDGLAAWRDAGRNPEKFRNAVVEARIDGTRAVLQRAILG